MLCLDLSFVEISDALNHLQQVDHKLYKSRLLKPCMNVNTSNKNYAHIDHKTYILEEILYQTLFP